MMYKTPFLAILLTALLASASPIAPAHQKVPEGAKLLAIDPKTNKLMAYGADGKLLGPVSSANTPTNGAAHVKRVASNCTPLSVDDVKKLPGWKALTDKAAQNWGKGSYNLVTNPPEYPDSPALVCASDNNPPMVFTGKPTCTTSAQKSEGKLVGTEGEVKLTQQDGVDAKSSITVTQEASIAVGVTFGVSFGIPGLGEANVGGSITTEFKNSLSTNKEDTVSKSQGHEISMKAPAGKTCHLEYTSKKCDQAGKGTVDYIASGWVWFNYNDKTHDHYKWALSIDGTLPNVGDRSSHLQYTSKLHSEMSTNYNGKCT